MFQCRWWKITGRLRLQMEVDNRVNDPVNIFYFIASIKESAVFEIALTNGEQTPSWSTSRRGTTAFTEVTMLSTRISMTLDGGIWGENDKYSAQTGYMYWAEQDLYWIDNISKLGSKAVRSGYPIPRRMPDAHSQGGSSGSVSDEEFWFPRRGVIGMGEADIVEREYRPVPRRAPDAIEICIHGRSSVIGVRFPLRNSGGHDSE
ncbi:hypothetical protein C8R45DRAFT_936094 [Mycena sanguinolenta]|nr:hypothetical protein C8R45DRAFT_936094 [Mycena sanguinolenta]